MFSRKLIVAATVSTLDRYTEQLTWCDALTR